MFDRTLSIIYWRSTTGEEFEGLQEFVPAVSEHFRLDLLGRNTDACGGGLYEFFVEVSNNLSLAEFVAEYARGAAGGGITYAIIEIFKKIKALFQRNKTLRPDVASFTMAFKGAKVIVYSLYENSIPETIADIIKALAEHHDRIGELAGDHISEIHIPIFNQVDMSEVCAYRVKLNVDENIPSFSRGDFFEIWGIRSGSRQFAYYLHERLMKEVRFYTEPEYDQLISEKVRSAHW